jgi:DNA helicase-2/ATP-dependent DNA helicase PcrA
LATASSISRFGYSRVAAIDVNKLATDFDKAGQKRVLDSIVERH